MVKIRLNDNIERNKNILSKSDKKPSILKKPIVQGIRKEISSVKMKEKQNIKQEYEGKSVEELTVEVKHFKFRKTELQMELKHALDTVRHLHEQNMTMLRKELTANEIAKMIANELHVNLEEADFQSNKDDPKQIAEALRMIRYHTFPREDEWFDQINHWKRQYKEAKNEKEQWKKQYEIMHKQVEELQHMQEQTKSNVTVKEKKKFVLSKAFLQHTTIEEVEEILRLMKGEQTEVTEIEEPVIAEGHIEEPMMEDIPIPTEEQEKVNAIPLKEANKKIQTEQKQTPKPQVEKVKEEKPKIVQFIENKKVEFEKSEDSIFTLWIKDDEGEKIPLKYIDFKIEKPEDFDPIMKMTNKVYFVFDTKKHQEEANSNFAIWLCLNAQKKNQYHFNFSLLDENKKTKGMPALDKY